MEDRQPSDTQRRVVAYLRVSTEDQMVSGYGIPAQREAVTRECERRGWITPALVEERVSGKIIGPMLESTLDALDQGVYDTLLVAKLDRLSRSQINGATIIERARKQGWALVALDIGIDMSTPMGEAMAGMVLVFAQYERRVIGERTRAGLAAARASGTRLGRPSGLAPDVVQWIIARRADGVALRQIAAELNQAGVRTSRGRTRWAASSVKHILTAYEPEVESAAS
jgi:DNA invertase Pin-like site-specific DNA recombinase